MTELARLDAGPTRRGVATGLVAGAGAALMVTASGMGDLAGIVLAVLGIGGVGVSAAVWRATAGHVVLTPGGLYDQTGACLVPLADVDAVITAPFAVKPSNGFTLRLRRAHPARWRPGLYWRWGRRLGVGGVPAGRAARHMADLLNCLLAARQMSDHTN